MKRAQLLERIQRLELGRERDLAMEALLAWGQDHSDPFATAMAHAYLGADPQAWQEIVLGAEQIDENELESLDAALEGWSWARRPAPPRWAHPEPKPTLRITRTLDLKGHNIGDVGAQALARQPGRLVTLDLSYNWIYDDGVRALAGSEHMSQLQTLSLNHNRISDEGLKALAASPHLRKLACLDLSNNPSFKDTSILALKESTTLEALCELDLSGIDLDESALAALEDLEDKLGLDIVCDAWS